MSKLFKKAGEVVLVNGGYVSDDKENAITHPAFVAAQVRAHRLVTIAAAMKGKTFVCEEVADINSLIAGIDQELNATAVQAFVSVPVQKKGELTEKLAEEALAFIGAGEGIASANRINDKMQEFCVINEFEEHGLFFTKGMSKLTQIYTIKEIVKAAKVVYAVLN